MPTCQLTGIQPPRSISVTAPEFMARKRKQAVQARAPNHAAAKRLFLGGAGNGGIGRNRLPRSRGPSNSPWWTEKLIQNKRCTKRISFSNASFTSSHLTYRLNQAGSTIHDMPHISLTHAQPTTPRTRYPFDI